MALQCIVMPLAQLVPEMLPIGLKEISGNEDIL